MNVVRRKTWFWTLLLVAGCVLFGCKGDDGPSLPGAVTLVFPENNSECLTGIVLNEQTSEVEFRWQAASNAATYRLTVRHLENGSTEQVTTSNTSARVVLDRGALSRFSREGANRRLPTHRVAASGDWLGGPHLRDSAIRHRGDRLRRGWHRLVGYGGLRPTLAPERWHCAP